MKARRTLFLFFSIALAVIAFAAISARDEETALVVIATGELPASHVLTDSDLAMLEMPLSTLPEGYFVDPALLIGETLRVYRSPGDILTTHHLGGTAVPLQANERGIAISVTDASGLAGLISAGDYVGITAIISSEAGTYAKVIADRLRIVYLSPAFEALDPAAYQAAADSGGFGGSVATTPERQDKGTVMLAVPLDAILIGYDFTPYGVDDALMEVSLLELLPALNASGDVELALFFVPATAGTSVDTSGVVIEDLVITPGPSPTPSPTPIGGAD